MSDQSFSLTNWTTRFNEWLDWFIPMSLRESPTSWFRARVLIVGAFLQALLIIVLLVQFFLVFKKVPPGFFISVISVIVAFSVPWSIRWLASYKIPGTILSFTFTFGLIIVAYNVTIFPSPVYFLFPLAPLGAVYFGNLTTGLISTSLLSVGTYFLYVSKKVAFTTFSPTLILNFMLYVSVALWGTLIFVWLYERSRIWSMSMLEETAQELRLANQAKSDFLARVSHELRTPLNAIIGYSEIIEEEAIEDDNVELSQDIGNVLLSGQHLLQLINDLLDLTQFETGRLTIQPQELNLKEFIGQLIEKIEPNIKKNENTFQLVDELSLEILYADPVRLQQILYNVLENACKFTKKGTISLCVKENSKQNPPELHFEIKDNGEGIPAELQEHIFDLFTQADTSKSRKHEGLGLGLPLSRHLCQLMGGDITVQSSPKDGTTFRIYIPIMNDSIETSSLLQRPV